MQLVLLALLPGIFVYLYQTGWGGLFNILIAITFACAIEAIAVSLRGQQSINELSDYSALVTGLLVALCLPPLMPWWIPALAAGFAIGIGKQLYGGLGHNVFNPAMAGYAMVLVSFPADLGLWLTSPDGFTTPLHLSASSLVNGGIAAMTDVDAMTGATALDQARTALRQQLPLTNTTHFYAGWLNLAYLSGGLWLLYRRVISWHIPITFLLTVAAASTLLYWLDDAVSLTPLFHLFNGATMLCAFFIATDPVSAATGKTGRLIYACGLGLLVVIIRRYGAYPDSVAFAILLMNCAVPLIDRLALSPDRRTS